MIAALNTFSNIGKSYALKLNKNFHNDETNLFHKLESDNLKQQQNFLVFFLSFVRLNS